MTVEMVSSSWVVGKPALRTRGGVVAAQHLAAAKVGAEILAAGGNAVDAALATSLALAVLEPWMSGLGGGGLMVIAPGDGAPPEVLEFGMRAPFALDPAQYPVVGERDRDLFGWPRVEGDRNVLGPLAIAVPGQAAGLGLAFERHASLPWRELCAPAIALAREGLPLDWHSGLRIAFAARELCRFEAARALYLPDRLPPAPPLDGSVGHLPLGRLAATLERIADAGPQDLLTGEVARLLVADVREAGGVLVEDDLGRYRARRVEPLAIAHGDAAILAAPGLSAGPTLAHALALIAGKVPSGPPGAAAYALWAEALLTAYERRLATMGEVEDRRDPACTTHLAVVDARGMMVSLTQTLLSLFGSKIVSPQTGILLNNGIMWFDPRPGRPNSMAPGKRPLANMCPVIATRDRAPWFALGASGGRRILPAVMQLSSMLIDAGLDLETAFHVPRIDVSGEPHVTADRRLSPMIQDALAARFELRRMAPAIHPNLFACPSAVLRDPTTGEAVAMTDPFQPVAGAAGAAAA
ncbi:MAG TPA: gamma-glutamyltransferase [Geminicoccaceae bacterium]|nr:gamma-glutamyltransferase [Geminicoccaceae bacterium]